MANTSILAAFERMKEHIVTALENKSNVGHTHTASEVGAQSIITGTAGQFVVIGDNGKVTTKTLPNAEGVSF